MKTYQLQSRLFFLFFSLLCVQIANANKVITPLPVNADYDKAKAPVGKVLFFDPIPMTYENA